MKNTVLTLSLALFSLICLAACTPTQSNRGNIVEEFRLSELTPGISTRTNVLKSLGSPTTTAPFDKNTWYYMGQKMEKKGIFDAKIKDEQIVIASFNDDGILQNIQRIDNQREEVPVIDRTTPTGGNEVTAIEQILGNVGRFNKSAGDENAAGTASGGVR